LRISAEVTSRKREFARRSALLCGMALLLVAASGCRQDMQDQPKYPPLRPSNFFGDERSERPLIEGTVARGHLNEDVAFYTGKGPDGKWVTEFPFPVTKEVLLRGQDRFNIYCAPCHGRLGDGNGKIPQRGFRHPPSFHIERLRQAEVGYLFDVITSGFGAMQDYSAQVAPSDRWAIIAYERALELSENVNVGDIPPQDRAKLDQAAAGGEK
jgi:mono/diheme cytochrome c family protein